MQRFMVSGADETTGAERTVTLEAADEAEATKSARERGILSYDVQTIKIAGLPLPPASESTDHFVGTVSGLPATYTPWQPTPYSALKMFARLTTVGGVLLIVAGVGCLLNGMSAGNFEMAMAGIASACGGAALAGLGECFLAVRNIAITTDRVKA